MYRIFPFLRWLPDLRSRKILVADLIAGVTVAMVLIPQSMAYADLANLPHVYGLYAACIGPAVAALFGSSRHLATGPVAMASLISASTVASVVPEGSDLFVDYALLLAWNFAKEIIKNNRSFMKRGGKFIIPIPKVKIVSAR